MESISKKYLDQEFQKGNDGLAHLGWTLQRFKLLLLIIQSEKPF
jgi:hypothetical protein